MSSWILKIFVTLTYVNVNNIILLKTQVWKTMTNNKLIVMNFLIIIIIIIISVDVVIVVLLLNLLIKKQFIKVKLAITLIKNILI